MIQVAVTGRGGDGVQIDLRIIVDLDLYERSGWRFIGASLGLAGVRLSLPAKETVDM